jgi:TP901 family phage tail tape measure protein
MAASIKIPTIFTAEDKFSSVVMRMTKGVTKFSRNTGAAVTRLDQKITSSFKRIGRFAQIGLGIGLAGIFSMAGQANLKYEDSLASVSAITGATGKDLELLEKISKSTAKETFSSGTAVLKAYELIGSAKPELLANVDALDAVTKSAILLSKASRMELEPSALALTDVMNQFNLGASKSASVVDVLAAGAKYGAAAIPLIRDSLLGFGATAKAANVNLTESVALVELFAAKGLKGAESGTKLRNVLTNMSIIEALPPEALRQLDKFGVNTALVADKTLPLIDRLRELSKIADDPIAMVKMFGKENKDAAMILLQNLPMYDDLVGKLGATGTAYEQAAKNSSTLAYWIESIKNSFLNAVTATQSNNKALDIAKNTLKFVASNMETVVGVTIGLISAYAALKLITWGVQAATFAYNIAMGVSAARSGVMTAAISGNSVAMGAYNIVAKLATIGQWNLNAAIAANPIGLMVAGIIALVGFVYLVIKYYDQWGAAASMLLGPLGAIIAVVMGIQKHWDSIVQVFKEDGILDGIKKIGVVIFDSMLAPIQQFIGFLAKIPGVGDLVAPAMKYIEGIRTNLDLTNDSNEPEKNPIIPTEQNIFNKMSIENTSKGSIDLNLNDPGGMVKDVQSKGNVNVPIMGNTQGQR